MRRFSSHAVIIGGYALLALVLTYPMILSLSTHVPFNPYIPASAHNANLYPKDLLQGVGDQWSAMWALGFIEHLFVESRRWSLFTDALFYPRGVDLTYSILFGFGLPLVVSIPFVHFLGVIPTYNLFIICSFILTAYSTFLLVRYLTKDMRAAFVSGIIFAFSPYHMARSLGHFNFSTSGMWIPLYILFFLRAVKGGRLLDLVVAPLVLTLTMAANPYYFVFLGFFTIIYVLYHVFSNRGPIVKGLLLKRLFSMGFIGSLLFLPLAWVILTHEWKDIDLYPSLSESFQWGADLLAFFVPSRYHPLWGDLVEPLYDHFASNSTEQTVYIGYMVLVLSLVAVLKAPREETRFWSLSALAFFVLSLGPFLHIHGKDIWKLNGMAITFPLPNLLLHFIPGLRALRVSSRFSVMLMLTLAVLVGYGTKHLLKRLEGRSGAALLFLGLIVASIAFEFFSAPLPMVDARIPKVYERIATEGGKGGTLLDVPADWRIIKYEYYQTAHHKRLLLGQAPRLSLSLVTSYADSVPFIRLFKNPELIKDYGESPLDKRDVMQFIQFFDLGFIVLHRDYLWPEVFDRWKQFLLDHFPIRGVDEDASIAAFYLAKDDESADRWMGLDGYLLDFGSATPQFFLAEGWSSHERWGDLTAAWSDAKESQLWVFFPRPDDFMMELRLLPFTFPSSPEQRIQVFVNGRFLNEIRLDANGWKTYSLHLPRTYLARGINAIRFVYRYTASPSKVLPGSQDQRTLAVAFDFIRFRPE